LEGGTTVKLRYFSAEVRTGSKAPVCPLASHFRSAPINGHQQTGPLGPVGAISGKSSVVQHARRARAYISAACR